VTYHQTHPTWKPQYLGLAAGIITFALGIGAGVAITAELSLRAGIIIGIALIMLGSAVLAIRRAAKRLDTILHEELPPHNGP
jgi:hypothetical protein